MPIIPGSALVSYSNQKVTENHAAGQAQGLYGKCTSLFVDLSVALG
jgi:hypothetical protein